MTVFFLYRLRHRVAQPVAMLQRYYGWYANRTRGIRRRAGAHEQPPAVEVEPVPPSLPEAHRRWAEHRCLHYPAPSDRPDSHPPAPHRYGAPPLARAVAALELSPHRHLGVSPGPPPPDPWVRGLLGCARAGWWPWPCLIPSARPGRGRRFTPDQTGSSGWTTQSGSPDGPLRQLYFRTAD